MAERGCITELESDRISEISDCKSLPLVTVLFTHRWFLRSDYRGTRPEAREGQQSVHDYNTHFKDGEAEAQVAREEQGAFLACTKELSGLQWQRLPPFQAGLLHFLRAPGPLVLGSFTDQCEYVIDAHFSHWTAGTMRAGPRLTLLSAQSLAWNGLPKDKRSEQVSLGK